jgi:hypothetical protein
VALPQIVVDFAERVRRYEREPTTADALLSWLEDYRHFDPLCDDTPCRWLAPKVLERLQAAQAGRITAEREHAAIVALLSEYNVQRAQWPEG